MTSRADSPHDADYLAALRQLWERSAYDRGFISNPFAGEDTARLGLRRTELLLEKLGNPQTSYEIVHVAGSKGKGSTCAFARALLTAAGKRTGLYTSPHLHSYRERIAIDGEPISESAFAIGWVRALNAAREVEKARPELGELTAFELLTAMALDRFAASECTTAVVEVGLGGTLDATNVVTPASTAITALDFEHTRVLGTSMPEIAANKAGIVKSRIPLATAWLPDDAVPVVEDAVRRADSSWLRAGVDWHWNGTWRNFRVAGPWGRFENLQSGLIGDHQVDNACLAIAAVWPMIGSGLTETIVRSGIRATAWPGRFEVARDAPPLVLDGAHTPAAATVLARTFAEEYPAQRCTVILGILQDKDPGAVATPLLPLASELVAVTPPTPRGMHAGALADRLRTLPIPVRVADGMPDALTGLHDRPVLVTGSLATVAAARETLRLAIPDPAFVP